jgi:hypothetical protein
MKPEGGKKEAGDKEGEKEGSCIKKKIRFITKVTSTNFFPCACVILVFVRGLGMKYRTQN